MTEKNMLEKINDLLVDLEDDEKRQAFFNDFDEFLTNYHQPTFEVGEYYARGEYIYRVEETDNVDVYVSAFNTFASIYVKASWSLDDITNDKPATAEQIAEFKLAEAIANTGQSADQIRQMLSAGKMPMGPWLELQKTAEELREVRDGKDRED